MPAPTSTTLWRTAPYNFKGYLWFDKPTVIFQCQVNQAITDLDYPIADITWDNTIQGAYTSCWRHMLVLFGSTAGADDLGRGRLRKPPNSNTLFIGRSSKGTQDGTCSISDDTYVTVLDSFLPWARIPYISDGIIPVEGTVPAATTQFKDWDLPYTIGVNGAPAVNLGFGPGFASYVDPNTNLLTMSFNAGTYTKGYDGNPSSWLWDVGDGTITSGSTTTAAITVTFPVGRRHIHLTVTQDNAMVTDRHLLIVACQDGGAYEPIKFFDVSSRNLELEGNRNTFNVHVYQDIPQSSYPDKSMVIYWEEEWYGSTKGSINVIGESGQTGCESIKFCGWHYQTDNETTAGPNGTESTVTFNCLDICGWLDHLPGFPIEINRMAAPTSWLQMKTANMDSYFWKGILYYFSTVPAITDFYDTNTGDMYGFARLGSGQKSLYQQIQELADRAIGYELTCNEQGMIYVRPNQNLLPSGSRANTNIITLNEGDIQSIRHLDVRHPKTHWNRGAAIIASTVDITSIGTPGTAFAVAPGQAPGQGPSATDRNEQLVLSQGELFTRTAGRDAEDNIDIGDIEIEHVYVGDIGLEPVYGQWGTLNIASQYAAQRDIQFSGTRARVLSSQRSVQCSPSGNSKSVKTILRPEVNGVAAVDDTPPVSNVAPEPPVAPPPAPIPTPNMFNLRHDGTSVIAHDSAHIGMGNYYTTSPRWSPGPSGGLSGALLQLRLDPYAPFLISKTGALPAYMLTTTGLFYIADILTLTNSWSHKQTWSVSGGISFAGGGIRPSSNFNGEIAVGFYDTSSHDAEFYWLQSNGSSVLWNRSIVANDNGCGIDIDNYGSRTIYAGVRTGSISGTVYRIVNGGVPVDLGTGNFGIPSFIQKPLLTFNGTQNSSISGGESLISFSGQTDTFWKTSDGGTTWVDTGLVNNGGVFTYSSIAFTENSNLWILSNSGSANLCNSFNAGNSFSVKASDSAGIIGYAQGYYPTQIEGSQAVYSGGPNGMGYSPDFGATLQNSTGNWVASIGAISGAFMSVIPLY